MYRTYLEFLKKREEKTPLVSVIASAINPETWKDIYNRFARKNRTPFEMIFVGPKPPIRKMPKNFKHIQTNVKPVQCIEIAARNATGDFLFQIGDDTFPLTDGFLNFMTFFALKINNKNCIHSPLYKNKEIREDVIAMSWRLKNLNVPLVSQFMFVKKETWHELGGLDINFVGGGSFPCDMQLNMIARGGYVSYNPMCVMCNPNLGRPEWRDTIQFKRKNVLAEGWRSQDTKFLDKMWLEKISPESRDKRCRQKRLKPVSSFSDVDILTKTQGPSDPRWD